MYPEMTSLSSFLSDKQTEVLRYAATVDSEQWCGTQMIGPGEPKIPFRTVQALERRGLVELHPQIQRSFRSTKKGRFFAKRKSRSELDASEPWQPFGAMRNGGNDED